MHQALHDIRMLGVGCLIGVASAHPTACRLHWRVVEANAGFASPAGHSVEIAMRLGSAFAASLMGVRTSRMPSRYDAATFS